MGGTCSMHSETKICIKRIHCKTEGIDGLKEDNIMTYLTVGYCSKTNKAFKCPA
jgi:hypothetical protein